MTANVALDVRESAPGTQSKHGTMKRSQCIVQLQDSWFISHSCSHNRLLAALPAVVHERLGRHVASESMPLGKVLYDAGDIERDIYFPTDSIGSFFYLVNDGVSAEKSDSGNEGIISVPAFMSGESTSSRAVVQRAGHAYRLPATQLKQ